MEGIDRLLELLGPEKKMLNHVCKTITKDQIHLPHPNLTESFLQSNWNGQTIRSLTQL
jgi:class I fructose-bisphosphate aldolase